MATQNREQKMDEVSDKLEAERVVRFGRVGVISIVTLIITLVTKSHDPLSSI